MKGVPVTERTPSAKAAVASPVAFRSVPSRARTVGIHSPKEVLEASVALGRARFPMYKSRMCALLIVATLALSGFPSSGSGGSSGGATTGEPVTTCTRVGQSAFFAPGKLGLCVERTPPCEGSNCRVCQSQH